jgi:hypothetical protein
MGASNHGSADFEWNQILAGSDAAFVTAASFSIQPRWEQRGGSCPRLL